MVRLSMIVLDSIDPPRLAAWWAGRLNGTIVLEREGEFCVIEAPHLPVNLGFQKVDGPHQEKNPVHLDLERRSDVTREQLVADWVAAGATHLARHHEPGYGWDVFSDPEGIRFCIGDAEEPGDSAGTPSPEGTAGTADTANRA